MPAIVVSTHQKPMTPNERGLPKPSVPKVIVTTEGVFGDYNKYRNERKDGDSDMAVLLVSKEDLDALQKEGWPVAAGDLGENFLLSGLSFDGLVPGQVYKVGQEVVIAISRICEPCRNLGVLPYVGKEKLKAFLQATKSRRGWYARVLSGGAVAPGDRIEWLRTQASLL